VEGHDLEGVGGGDEAVGEQVVGIERDRRHQRLELVRRELLGAVGLGAVGLRGGGRCGRGFVLCAGHPAGRKKPGGDQG
jgi:hypothetical protein